MDSAIIIVVIILAAALFTATGLTVLRYLPHLYKKGKADGEVFDGKVIFTEPKNGTPYLAKLKNDKTLFDGGFKILTCADTHINSDESELTFTLLERFLDREKPDLVVLVGDNVVGRTDTVMQEKLSAFFEKREQYWGFVLGNHDSEYRIKTLVKEGASDTEVERITAESRKWMFDSLSKGEHCIVKDGGEGLHGSGNCVVNLKNSNGIIQSLFFFDSGDYLYGIKRRALGTEKRCYDYLREDQLNWYKKSLLKITEENDGITPKSTAFFHIPLPEFQKAFKASRKKRGNAKLIYGTNYEKVCSSDVNGEAFEAFKDLNSTKLVVCGHDHKNDSCIEYEGVKLMYSQGLQYDGAYNRRKKAPFLKLLNRISDRFCCFTEGVSILTIRTDGSVEPSASYAQKEGLYDGLEKYYKRAFLTGTIKGIKKKEVLK